MTNDFIFDARVKAFNKKELHDFDDVCFLFYNCVTCKKDKIGINLLPVVDKSDLDDFNLLLAQKKIFSLILKKEISFLKDECFCDCCSGKKMNLKRIIYCHYNNGVDYHNYFDDPFKKYSIKKYKLVEKEKLVLFIDTETNGLPINWRSSYKNTNNWPRVVQMAWILSNQQGEIIEKGNYIVKPSNFIISIESSKIHKITNDLATKVGYDLIDVLNKFESSVRKANYIVAHNLSFDLNIILAETIRTNFISELLEKKQFCTMESSIKYCNLFNEYGLKRPKLSELYYKLFNNFFEDSHNAEVDVEKTYECFYELQKLNIININA